MARNTRNISSLLTHGAGGASMDQKRGIVLGKLPCELDAIRSGDRGNAEGFDLKIGLSKLNFIASCSKHVLLTKGKQPSTNPSRYPADVLSESST